MEVTSLQTQHSEWQIQGRIQVFHHEAQNLCEGGTVLFVRSPFRAKHHVVMQYVWQLD